VTTFSGTAITTISSARKPATTASRSARPRTGHLGFGQTADTTLQYSSGTRT
jgi:hypothetical protein